MKSIPVSILLKDEFLIVDNAVGLSPSMQMRLEQLFHINDLDFDEFKYKFVNASDGSGINAFERIEESRNIVVSTTFTTIKSNTVEDFISAGIQQGLKDKNVFSLMPFSVVGDDFEYYKDEIKQLAANNVLFYFISENCTTFELYQWKK